MIQKVPKNFSRIPKEIVDSLSISAWENLLAIFQENQQHISLLPFSMRNTSIFSADGLPTFNGGDYLKSLNQYVEKALSRPDGTSLHLITLEHFLENTIQLAVKAWEDNLSAIAAAKTTTVNADEDQLPSWDVRDMSSITPEEISHYKDYFLSVVQESRSILNKVVKTQRLPLEKPQHQTKMGDITIQFAK